MTEAEIERGSLADAFKGSGGQLTAGLADILAGSSVRSAVPRKPSAAQTPATAPKRTPVALSEPSEATQAARGSSEKATASRPAAAPVQDPNKVENVATYIEPDVLAVVKAAKRKNAQPGQPDLTYDELLLDAIDELGVDRIREEFSPAATEGGGLVARRQRRVRGTGGVQIQLRLSVAQQAQLEALRLDVGAPSRSAFCTTVYRLAYVKTR